MARHPACETWRVNVAAYEIAAIETVLAGVMRGMRNLRIQRHYVNTLYLFLLLPMFLLMMGRIASNQPATLLSRTKEESFITGNLT